MGFLGISLHGTYVWPLRTSVRSWWGNRERIRPPLSLSSVNMTLGRKSGAASHGGTSVQL